MGTVNKVILVGNLGRDAELRYTPGGAAVATLSLATTEAWNDKGGQRQEKTEWHRVILWGKQAETLNEYLASRSRSLRLLPPLGCQLFYVGVGPVAAEQHDLVSRQTQQAALAGEPPEDDYPF